jgi:uncharacterized protein YndB with AHSA1/START domain
VTTNTASSTVTTQVYRVYIKATPQKIWDAITQPEWSARYGYAAPGEYDLRPGGAYRAAEEYGAGGGWAWVLSDLKTLVETGSPFAA